MTDSADRIRTAALGSVLLPKLDGVEICPGVWLIGEPTPMPGTDKLRCLANVSDNLVLVELRIRFTESLENPWPH